MEGHMTIFRRLTLSLTATAALALALPSPGWPQPYPSRPITMVVPYPSGGPTDALGRIVAEGMRASLGQYVIVENVGGASGSIGVGRVARADPDGYTLSLGNWPTYVVNPVVFPLKYDVIKDFEPISLIANNPLLIVAKKAMPANTLKELIAWLKEHPDEALLGTAGGVSHVAGIFFQSTTGTHLRFVPYRGLGPAMQDLAAGRIDMLIDSPTNSLPQVRAGTIKAYALMAGHRLSAAPDIPTADEAGLPGFHMSSWHAIWAPKGVGNDIVAKLNDAVVNALADPIVRQRLADLGQEIFPREQQTPAALAAYHKAEIEKWWPILKAANLKAE
jgi:tripartite-type tricarboxylate transporter receptor subunit TctC